MNAYELNFSELFPFDLVRANSNIYIYGAGILGLSYASQVSTIRYCNIIGFIDKNWSKYTNCDIPVISVDDINDEFDFIVVAIKVRQRGEDIVSNLLKRGIKKEKIIYSGIREVKQIHLSTYGITNVDSIEFNEKKLDSINIAIRLGNGLGSAIVKKKIVDYFSDTIPNASIDIYTMQNIDNIKAIYYGESTINNIITDSGIMYNQVKNKYDISFQLMDYFQLDYYDRNKLLEYEAVLSKLIDLEKYTADYESKTNHYVRIQRQLYRGYVFEDAFSANGLIPVYNGNVRLQLNTAWLEKYNQYKLTKYITINFGNGMSKKIKDNITKQWPYEYFQKFVKFFKEKYYNIELLQIGDANAPRIEKADKYILGENIELIKHILKGAIFHLDIEGGLVHLATNLGTMCMVIFGPTKKEYYGYERNCNIVYEKCNGCFGLYHDHYKCAKGLSDPICMTKIYPEYVMKYVEDILNNVEGVKL